MLTVLTSNALKLKEIQARFYGLVTIFLSQALCDIYNNSPVQYYVTQNIPDYHQSILHQTSLKHLFLDVLSMSYCT